MEFFATLDETHHEKLLFLQSPDSEGLPFPLYLDVKWKVLITIGLSLSLIYGLKLRLIIISYLRAPETKLGPIDYLVWMDQINGLFLFLVVLMKLVGINSPVAMTKIFGEEFCEWVDFPSFLYVVGATVWSCFTAIYRIVYIKAQNMLKYKIGEKRLLNFFLCLGTGLCLFGSSILSYSDDKSTSGKMCFHYSNGDLEIMRLHQEYSDPNTHTRSWKKAMVIAGSTTGTVLTTVELLSYAVFFQHVSHHNNIIAVTIVEPSVIKKRNRTNAISMVGQLASWIMEVWYLVLVGVLSTNFDMDMLREVAPLLKHLEFFLIPLVQIYTSPPIKKFLSSKTNKN